MKQWPVLSVVATVLLCVSSLEGSSEEATPWSHNFLELRPKVSCEYLHAQCAKKCHSFPASRYVGNFGVCGSPYPEVDVDLLFSGSSQHTLKGDVRVEKQMTSDLERSLLASSVVIHGTSCTHRRANTPTFFEMARQTGEIGIGLGRHISIKERSFTQLFGYAYTGVGSQSARWSSFEVGVQYSKYQHLVRCTAGYLLTFGNRHDRFSGIACLHSHAESLSVGYTYKASLGTEWQLSYTFRRVHNNLLRNSSCVQLTVSSPLSL
jgi:hypothetical protein